VIHFFCAGEIILVPKRVIADIGWLAHIHDREGNVIGILENDPGLK
jgi:predicted enzyme related to lactoylglutathione lyase